MTFDSIPAGWAGVTISIQHGTHEEHYEVPMTKDADFSYRLLVPRKTLAAIENAAKTAGGNA